MLCLDDANRAQHLSVIRHKYQAQQSWIDRAEEDLLCAVILCRSKTAYSPHANICYFLHQTIEKWLKAFLAINGIAFSNTHELFFLLRKSSDVDGIFLELLQRLDIAAPVVLASDFSSSVLRYGKSEEVSNVRELVVELFPVAFQIRKVVKKYIRRLDD